MAKRKKGPDRVISKKDTEYWAAMKRLEKAQAKYVQKPEKKKTTISKAENKKWEQKRVQRYNARVWRGWRESDGKSSPVTVYNAKDLET